MSHRGFGLIKIDRAILEKKFFCRDDDDLVLMKMTYRVAFSMLLKTYNLIYLMKTMKTTKMLKTKTMKTMKTMIPILLLFQFKQIKNKNYMFILLNIIM